MEQTRKNVDETFHIKNFVYHYKDYINKGDVLRNEKKFYEKLDNIRSEILKVKSDICNKNILFVCDEDISDYVFLSCFTVLDTLVSHRKVNAMNLHDIWWGNSRADSRLDEDEMLFSEQDIREEVLCVYVDQYMGISDMVANVINTVISSRSNMVSRKGRNLITWVFYHGSIESMGNNKFGSLYRHFTGGDQSKYSIVKLKYNSVDSIGGGVVSSKGSSGKDSLNDLY